MTFKVTDHKFKGILNSLKGEGTLGIVVLFSVSRIPVESQWYKYWNIKGIRLKRDPDFPHFHLRLQWRRKWPQLICLSCSRTPSSRFEKARFFVGAHSVEVSWFGKVLQSSHRRDLLQSWRRVQGEWVQGLSPPPQLPQSCLTLENSGKRVSCSQKELYKQARSLGLQESLVRLVELALRWTHDVHAGKEHQQWSHPTLRHSN